MIPVNGGDSVDLSVDVRANDQTEAPEVTLNSVLKTLYSTTYGNEQRLPIEDISAATPTLVVLNKAALEEESTDMVMGTETPLLTTYSSKKKSSLSQAQSCVTQIKAQRSRCSSRLESRRSRSFMTSCNDDGKPAGEILANVVRDSSLRSNKRLRKSPHVRESDAVDSAAFVSNGSLENGSEVVTVESDVFSLNEGSTIESGCKLEHSDIFVECLDGDVEFSKGLDLQIKSVFIKKKRKPNRKRVTNGTAGPSVTLDKEIGLEVEVQNASLNSQEGGQVKESCLKDDGDEHLPLVKRARVRMGKSSSVEELSSCSHTEEKTMIKATVSLSGQNSMDLKVEKNSLAGRESLVASETLENVLSTLKHCTQDTENRTESWRGRNEQSFGCSVDGEAALPPSKRLHRALEAMSANAAEDGKAFDEASPILKTLFTGCCSSSMKRGPHMAVESKVGNGLGLSNTESLDIVSTQVCDSGFSTSLNPIISEESVKSSMKVDFCNQAVDIFKTKTHDFPKDVSPDARVHHIDGINISNSFGGHAVRTADPTQSPGYFSDNLDERRVNPLSCEVSLDALSPLNDGDTKNIESSNCEPRVSDKEVDASEKNGISLSLLSCSNEIFKASPRNGTIGLQCRAEGVGCEDNNCLEPTLDEKSEVKGM